MARIFFIQLGSAVAMYGLTATDFMKRNKAMIVAIPQH
jgi:hypothetical protein